jgi:ferritin-like metal-binding protein YciE
MPAKQRTLQDLLLIGLKDIYRAEKALLKRCVSWMLAEQHAVDAELTEAFCGKLRFAEPVPECVGRAH